MAGVSRATERRVASMTAMTAARHVANVREPTYRHRDQPSAAEREAETVKVHTKYYVTRRALVTPTGEATPIAVTTTSPRSGRRRRRGSLRSLLGRRCEHLVHRRCQPPLPPAHQTLAESNPRLLHRVIRHPWEH